MVNSLLSQYSEINTLNSYDRDNITFQYGVKDVVFHQVLIDIVDYSYHMHVEAIRVDDGWPVDAGVVIGVMDTMILHQNSIVKYMRDRIKEVLGKLYGSWPIGSCGAD